MFRLRSLKGYRNINIDLLCHPLGEQSVYKPGKVIAKEALRFESFSLSVSIFKSLLELQSWKCIPMKIGRDDKKKLPIIKFQSPRQILCLLLLQLHWGFFSLCKNNAWYHPRHLECNCLLNYCILKCLTNLEIYLKQCNWNLGFENKRRKQE